MILKVTQRILDYDKYLSESEYLDEVAAAVDADDLFVGVVELLKSSDEQTLSTTLLFVQDVIQWYPGEARQSIKEKYPESIVVRAIEGLLYYPDRWIRMQSGYVLGKTLSYGSVPAMTEAFHHWYERDPLMMKFFVGELGWLGAENIDEIVEKMMASSCFVTRWVSVSFQDGYDKHDDIELRKHKKQCWDRLRGDVNSLVRQEAEYEYQTQLSIFQGHKQFSGLFRPSKKQKIINEKYEPPITLMEIKSQFGSHLHQNGLRDYSIDQLEAFIADHVTRLDEK
jgi:hypothetical protein